MAAAWNRVETLKLNAVWGDETIQAQLEGCKRNQEVFEKIATELKEAGFERSEKQCRNKMKKLKADYRNVRDKRNTTGKGRYPEWDFYDAIDTILGHRPVTQPPVVVSSMAGTTAELVTATAMVAMDL